MTDRWGRDGLPVAECEVCGHMWLPAGLVSVCPECQTATFLGDGAWMSE